LALALTLSLAPVGVCAAVESGDLFAAHMTPANVASDAPTAASEDSAAARMVVVESGASVPQVEKASPAVLKGGEKSAANGRQNDGGAIQPASLTIDAGRAYAVTETAYPVDPVTAAHTHQFGATKAASADDVNKTSAATIGEADGHAQMPYALVLALIALIGLVPVSRRNH